MSSTRALAIAIFLALMSGCNQDLPGVIYEKPGQAEAVNIVWNQVYGMSRYASPTIYWVEGAALNCPGDPDAWTEVGPDDCMYGRSTTHGAAIAWSPGRSPYSLTSFAHELLHWKFYATGGDYEGHESPEWQPGGLKDQAVAALASEGM